MEVPELLDCTLSAAFVAVILISPFAQGLCGQSLLVAAESLEFGD